MNDTTTAAPLKLGNHEFRTFTAIDAAFGASHDDYPSRDDLPPEYRSMRGAGCDIASSLFFSGGSLADHGRKLKAGVDSAQFHSAARALLCSFAPKHEVKIGTVGWLIDTYTVPA